MFEALVTRLGAAALVLLGVGTLVFLLIHLVPGDPVEAMLGEGARPADRAALTTLFKGFNESGSTSFLEALNHFSESSWFESRSVLTFRVAPQTAADN